MLISYNQTTFVPYQTEIQHDLNQQKLTNLFYNALIQQNLHIKSVFLTSQSEKNRSME